MSQSWNRYVVIILLTCLSSIRCKNFVLKATRTVSRPLNVPVEEFRQWFSLPDLPVRLVSLNPGVEKVVVLSDSCHRGFLKPIKFPWTTIKCSIDYDLNFIKGKSLAVDCREDAVSQTFEGSDALVNAMSSLKLLVAGSAKFYINEPLESFSVGVSALVSFPVPDYYPDILLKSMESAGSAVLQKKVEYDLGTLLGNILDFYGIWAADNESNSQIFSDEKTRQLTRVSV